MTPPSVTPSPRHWLNNPPFYSDLVPSSSRHFSRIRQRNQRQREFEEPDFSTGFDYEDYSTAFDEGNFAYLDDGLIDYPETEPETTPKPIEEDEAFNEVDFSQATRNEDGKLCVLKEETVESVVKEPLLQCTQKEVEKCHYTYVTKFIPTKEEVSLQWWRIS